MGRLGRCTLCLTPPPLPPLGPPFLRTEREREAREVWMDVSMAEMAAAIESGDLVAVSEGMMFLFGPLPLFFLLLNNRRRTPAD